MDHTRACALQIAHVIGMVGMGHLSTVGPCSGAGARFAAACSFSLHFVPFVFLLGFGDV